MKRVYIILYLLFIGLHSLAQAKLDSTKIYIDYTSTGAINKTQNSSSFLLNNSFNIVVKKTNFSFLYDISYLYGEQDSKLTNKDFSTTLNIDEYKYAPFKNTFYWSLVIYNSIYSLLINQQKEMGFGLAYFVVNSKDRHLSISDGIIYDESNFDFNGYDTEHNAYRNSLKVKFHFLFKDMFQLDGLTYIQNSFIDNGDYIIKSKSSISFKICKWLSVGSTVIYNKSSFIERQNLLLTYGLFINKNF